MNEGLGHLEREAGNLGRVGLVGPDGLAGEFGPQPACSGLRGRGIDSRDMRASASVVVSIFAFISRSPGLRGPRAGR